VYLTVPCGVTPVGAKPPNRVTANVMQLNRIMRNRHGDWIVTVEAMLREVPTIKFTNDTWSLSGRRCVTKTPNPKYL
jgi:hypothetical protein